MKKLNLFSALCIVLLIFSSCSDNEDNNETETELSVVGGWSVGETT